jgi:hypothetical protein
MNETNAQTDKRADYIAGLRDLADRLERHPDAPLPYEGRLGMSLVMPHSPEEMAAAARCYGGRKVEETDGFALVDGIPGLRIKVLSALAQVCERVETGEVEEYEDVVVMTEAVTRTVTRTRPKTEWRCPESLLQLDTAEVPA